MWDDFGLGIQAKGLSSFLSGETYLLRDGRVAMGGMVLPSAYFERDDKLDD